MDTIEQLKIKRTANSNLQNEINISVIFNYIRTGGSSYRAQISKALNISAPAVSRAVEHLIGKGHLIESGTIKTEHGKNAGEVKINPDIGYIVSVDLVKEHARLAVTDFGAAIRAEYTGVNVFKTENLQEEIIREIEEIGGKYRLERKGRVPLKGISVGVPAATDFTTGSIHTVLYESLEKIDLRKVLSEQFRVPVFIENISNLSAVGESNCGHGRNYKNIIFLEISNGIGAGIIADNNLIRGKSGYAGEIGYSVSGTEQLESFKQRKGALERLASVDSMVYDLKKELLFGAESMLNKYCDDPDSVEASMIFDSARHGDKLSLRVIDRAVKYVSLCTVNLILTLDPEIIFIGGDIYHMPGVMPLFVEPLIEYVRNTLPFHPPRIQLSSLGEDAGIIGASYMATETLLTEKYPYRIE